MADDKLVIKHEHGEVEFYMSTNRTNVCVDLVGLNIYEMMCPGCDNEHIALSAYKLHKSKCMRHVCDTCAMPVPRNMYDHDCVFRTAASSSGFSEVNESLDERTVQFVLRTPPTLKDLPGLIKKAVEWVKANGRSVEASMKFRHENPV